MEANNTNNWSRTFEVSLEAKEVPITSTFLLSARVFLTLNGLLQMWVESRDLYNTWESNHRGKRDVSIKSCRI